MAKPRTLVPRNGYQLGLLVTVLLAAIFRLWHLSSLPPGLASGEARIGLAAYQLAHHGVWPSFSLSGGGSPLLVMLEAIAVALFGTTPWILRLVPALIGIAAVPVAYLWAKAWFGRRTGLLTAFFLAVTPWAVTMSRNIQPAALAALLITALLYYATRLWHRPTTRNMVGLGVITVLASLTGPVGWAALLIVLVAALAVVVGHKVRPPLRHLGLWLATVVLAILPALLVIAHRKGLGRSLFHSAGVSETLGGIGTTLLAFAVHGDDNYLHNLGGQPLLNVFVAIMFIAGILVTITRWHHRSDRAILLASVAALLPAFASPQTASNAATMAPILPLCMALAAIGVGYLLEVWYATFPINSAARLTGQLAMLLLLALTAYQGYTQYFSAWADSSETHRAYGDAALGIGTWIKQLPAGSNTVVVANGDDATVLAYALVGRPEHYQVIGVPQVAANVTQRPLHLALTTDWRDQVVAALKTSASGGELVAHQSSFDGADLYYTYELP